MSAATLRAAVLALLLPLAGCVNMSGLSGESKYACAAPEGVACNSVSGTYVNAVHDNLPSQRAGAQAARSAETEAAASASGGASAPVRQPLAGALSGVAQPGPDGRPGLALRSQAKVLRLWTKPWEDADGDLWDQGFVYVQVDAGRWQIDHVRQRIRDQYTPLRPPSGAVDAPPAGASESPGADVPSLPSANGAPQRPGPFSLPPLGRPSAGPGSPTP